MNRRRTTRVIATTVVVGTAVGVLPAWALASAERSYPGNRATSDRPQPAPAPVVAPALVPATPPAPLVFDPEPGAAAPAPQPEPEPQPPPQPAADAAKLRAAFRVRESSAEGARDALNKAYEGAQAALRTEPFDPAALRAALAEARAARPAYDQVMQDILLTGASAMSVEGRKRLADWPSSRPTTATR